MFGFSRLDAHQKLVEDMADAVGVDLTEEMQEGHLTPAELRATVLRCVGCREAGECQGLLDATAAGSLDEAPAYCRNHDLFETMKARR